MTDGHAFREAGGPGGVHDLGDVVVSPGDRREEVAPPVDGARVEDDRVGREPPGLPREQVSRRDQTTGPRVGEHMLDLARTERLVHDDDDRACGERAEERRRRVPTSLEQDRDAVVGPHSRGAEGSAEHRRTLAQGGIVDGAASFHDGDPVAEAGGALPQEERRVERRGHDARCAGNIDRQRAPP